MSLEAKIEELTGKIDELIAVMGNGEAKAPAKKAPASGGAKKATTASKKKGPSPDDVAEAFGTYLTTGSATEKKKARTVVKAIVDKFEVERITALDESDYEEALQLLKDYQSDEDPLDLFDDEGDDDSML